MAEAPDTKPRPGGAWPPVSLMQFASAQAALVMVMVRQQSLGRFEDEDEAKQKFEAKSGLHRGHRHREYLMGAPVPPLRQTVERYVLRQRDAPSEANRLAH